MGFFDGTKLLLKLTASIKLTEDGILADVILDGDPQVVNFVQQLLQPEREPSFEDILAAAMRGDGGPMESPSFEDALAAAMSGRGSPIDIGEILAQAMRSNDDTEFPDYQEVFAAYMVDEYQTENELVNQGAMAIALVQEEELPEDVVVPPAVSRIASRYLQGVRDCHCGNPSCKAHFLFKVIEAYFAEYGEPDQLSPEDVADAQNYQDGYRA